MVLEYNKIRDYIVMVENYIKEHDYRRFQKPITYGFLGLLLLGIGYCLGNKDSDPRRDNKTAITRTYKKEHPRPTQTSVKTVQKQKPYLPRLNSKPVEFVELEPIYVSDPKTMNKIRNAIEAYKLTGRKDLTLDETSMEKYLEQLLTPAVGRVERNASLSRYGDPSKTDFLLMTGDAGYKLDFQRGPPTKRFGFGTKNDIVSIDVTNDERLISSHENTLGSIRDRIGPTIPLKIHYFAFRPTAYKSLDVFLNDVNEKLQPILDKELGPKTTREIDYAFFTDMNKDGEKEILTCVTAEDGALEFYKIDNEESQVDKLELITRIKNIDPLDFKVIDLTGNNKPEILLKADLKDKRPSDPAYTVIISDEDAKYKTYQTPFYTNLTDLDGNGIAEFHMPNGELYTWNGGYFTYKNPAATSLSSIKGAMFSAAANPNKSEADLLIKEIESTYSSEVLDVCREMMLAKNQFSQRLNLEADRSMLLKLSLPEFLALSVVQSVARDYERTQEVKREQELIRSYGGDPGMHTLQRDAHGNIVGLRENPNYRPQTSYDDNVVRERSGNTERGRIYATPEAAQQRRQELQNQQYQRNFQEGTQRARQDVGRAVDAGRQAADQAAQRVQQGLQDIFKQKKDKPNN